MGGERPKEKGNLKKNNHGEKLFELLKKKAF